MADSYSEWRKVFLDGGEILPSEERFFPYRSRKGLTSSEHFARYLFAAGLCRGKRVLDVACGSGYGAYILKSLGAAKVVGEDRDPEAVRFAEKTYATPGLEFRTGDAGALDIEGTPFDVVVSFETVEHVTDPEGFLENVKRRLATDGLFLVSCPNDARSLWVSPFHLRHYTYQEFRSLVARYFPDPRPVAQIHAI